MHRSRDSARRRRRAGLPRVSLKRRRGGLSAPSERSSGQVAVIAGAALAAGAALEFFLDPRSGRRRRNLVHDRTKGAVRRRTRRIEHQLHYEAGRVTGLAHAIAHRDQGARELDDVSLAHKVESELFRDRTVPKGQISINADRGTIVLRGQLEDEQQIHRIERTVRDIAGVRDVENLLHGPGVPAPPRRRHGNHRAARPAA